MIRGVVVLMVAAGGIALLAGCSSSSSGSKTKTAVVSVGRTVLPNGTVVTVPGGGSANATRAAASGGTPGAVTSGEGSAVPQNTPVPGTTAAAVATSVAATVTAAPPGSATRPAGAGTPVAIAPTPADIPASDGFSLAVPDHPQGDFTVTANVTGVPAYHGFNVQLTFDASLLSVTSIDQGTVLGGADKSFCPAPVIASGSGLLACVILGTSNSTASGAVAVFHFHVLKGGSATLHFTTFAEGGSDRRTFLVGPNTDNPTPLTVPLHDATITVTP